MQSLLRRLEDCRMQATARPLASLGVTTVGAANQITRRASAAANQAGSRIPVPDSRFPMRAVWPNPQSLIPLFVDNTCRDAIMGPLALPILPRRTRLGRGRAGTGCVSHGVMESFNGGIREPGSGNRPDGSSDRGAPGDCGRLSPSLGNAQRPRAKKVPGSKFKVPSCKESSKMKVPSSKFQVQSSKLTEQREFQLESSKFHVPS